ncbi:MAG: hypothetical protein ACSLEN_12155 [Candidatus Malihini olakiniferum]
MMGKVQCGGKAGVPISVLQVKKGTDRPRLIYIICSNNVLVDGITLTHSPSFHVVMRYAHDFNVNNTKMLSP